MIGDMALGQYYPGDSFLHRLDPRAKITALFFLYIGIFFLESGLSYLVASLLCVGLLVSSRVPFRVYWRSTGLIAALIIFGSIFNIFFTQGEILWQWGMLKITREGFWAALYMALRILLLLYPALVLTFTTTPMAVTNGLEDMGRPLAKLGLPVHEIAMIMSIALRFIPTIMDEADTILKAQKSRGADFSLKNWRQLGVHVAAFAVPLFVGAFRRSDELALAMEARGYRGGVGRTTFRTLKLRSADFFAMALCLVLTIFAAMVRWWI
ncbi:MAG: energy-coupling factor transporter transmembrane component T [Bacillota bacterium]|nr:energy-coupling factor transporter transmembrane component T [Bacillota bacterium]